MILVWPSKDPDEVLDYEINWTARLAGDTISSSEWVLPTADAVDPLVLDSDNNDTTSATAWLSGGKLGKSYEITNRVVTATGRTMDQIVVLNIK